MLPCLVVNIADACDKKINHAMLCVKFFVDDSHTRAQAHTHTHTHTHVHTHTHTHTHSHTGTTTRAIGERNVLSPMLVIQTLSRVDTLQVRVRVRVRLGLALGSRVDTRRLGSGSRVDTLQVRVRVRVQQVRYLVLACGDDGVIGCGGSLRR